MPAVSVEVINDFLIEHQGLVYKYVYKKLKTAIADDSDGVVLFTMPHLGSTARVERKDYIVALENMIQHYLKAEEYERIPGCQALITQHHINELIRSSK